MERRRVDKHPGIKLRRWTDAQGRQQCRYDGTYRGRTDREHTKTFARLGDADRWLRGQRAKADRGAWIDPNRGQIPLGEWDEHWLAVRTVR